MGSHGSQVPDTDLGSEFYEFNIQITVILVIVIIVIAVTIILIIVIITNSKKKVIIVFLKPGMLRFLTGSGRQEGD